MKVLQSLRGQVKNNSEGTTVRPLLMSVTQSKTKGHIFTIKIGDLSYECVQYSNCLKWRTFRCKNWGATKSQRKTKKNRKADCGGDKCSFKMKVKNISGLGPVENSHVFWRTQSWQVLENETAAHHSCTGSKMGNETGIKTSSSSALPELGQLPEVVLSRVLSFLSMKDLFHIQAVRNTMTSLNSANVFILGFSSI